MGCRIGATGINPAFFSVTRTDFGLNGHLNLTFQAFNHAFSTLTGTTVMGNGNAGFFGQFEQGAHPIVSYFLA